MNEELASKILGAMKKAYSGEQTVRWLANLNEDLPVVPKGKAQNAGSSPYAGRSVTILDKLFDDFQRYCFEFNKTISDPEFRVQCERPKPTNIKTGYKQEPVICHGHMSTAMWAMIVHAQEHCVTAFIIPIDFLLGFQREQFEPHLVMTGSDTSSGNIHWDIDGVVVRSDMLPTISKKLFSALIRVFNGEVEYTTKFQVMQPSDEVKQTAGVKHEGDVPLRPKSMDTAGGFDLLKPSVAPNLALGQAIREQQAAIQAQKNTGSNAPQPVRTTSQNQAQSAPPRGGGGSTDDHLNMSANTVHTALEVFSRVVEKELDGLMSLNMQAMQNQDIVFVQKTIKRTATLKGFKDWAANAAAEWNGACNE
jgi:hypothetical protein